MKVVSQLARHFWKQGALSREQAEYLVRQGFVKAEVLGVGVNGRLGEKEQSDSDDTRFEVYDVFAHVESRHAEADEILRRKAGARRRGPRPGVLTVDGLCEALRGEFRRRAESLAALVRLAELLVPCQRWEDAAVALRNVSDERFAQAVGDAVRAEPELACDLGDAVDPHPFLALVDGPTGGGPVVHAFRALLHTEDAGQLGKYVWILQLPEVVCVSNLLQVRRRL